MENLKGFHLTNNPVQQDWADRILPILNNECDDLADYSNFIATLDKIRDEVFKAIIPKYGKELIEEAIGKAMND